MVKRKIDFPKMVVISLMSIVILIILICFIAGRMERLNKSNLYRNETYMQEVFDSFENKLEEMTSKDKYYYNDEEISIFDIKNNGIRLYDDIHQKDNDIVKLIPKDFFFIISPNGKNYVGEKYGFFIKTIKDLEEEQLESSGYISSNYYKSIVIVYALDVRVPNNDDESYYGYSDIKIIASGEYHSYKNVSSEKEEMLDVGIINDIKDNWVVTYYSTLENKEISISQYKCELELKANVSNILSVDLFEDGKNILTSISSSPYCYFNIKTDSDSNNRQEMKLVVKYTFSIYDNVWSRDTRRPDLTTDVEIKNEYLYNLK